MITVGALLSTLLSPKVVASIYDADDSLVSEIKASTHASLDDVIEAREVSFWEIISSTQIKVHLKKEEVDND